MISEGYVSPMAQIEARVQAVVGEFLSARTKLNELTQSRDIDISAQAKKLLVRQITLEAELQKQMKVLDSIKAGAYSIGNITGLGVFANELVAHMKRVKGLFARASGVAPESGFGAISPTKFFMTLAALGFGLKVWETTAKVKAARR